MSSAAVDPGAARCPLAGTAAAALLAALATAVARLFVGRTLLAGDEGPATLLLTGWVWIVAFPASVLLEAASSRGTRRRLPCGAGAVAAAAVVGFLLAPTGPALRVGSAAAAAAAAWIGVRAVGAPGGSRWAGQLAVLLGALLACSAPWMAWRAPRPLPPRPSDGPRPDILVFALDGLDWAVFRELSSRGRLPVLGSLASAGTAAPLATLRPTSSPYLWNSIYSGFTPAMHRLRVPGSLLSGTVVAGHPPRGRVPDVLASFLRAGGASEVRQPHALWDVLRAGGYTTAVLGAWEAAPVPRAGAAFLDVDASVAPADAASATIDLADRRHVWLAPGLASAASSIRSSAVAIPRQEWRTLLDDVAVERLASAVDRPGVPAADRRLARVRAAYATDRFRVHLAAAALRETASPRFLFVYLIGADGAQHVYQHLRSGPAREPAEAGLPDVVARYYERLDGWVGLLVAKAPGATVFVVSDHGVDGRPVSGGLRTGRHEDAPPGVFITAPAAAPVDTAHILDVAPTVLAAAGLPVLASMEGRVLPSSLPTVVVERWTDAAAAPRRTPPRERNREVEERLRALGYVEP